MPYKCIEERKAYAKESYAFYKSRKICVRCHKDVALDGLVLCLSCAEYRSEKSKERRIREKAIDIDAYRLSRNEAARKLRQARKENGVCARCGQRPPQKGRVSCVDCLLKDRWKRSGILRAERPSYGSCYVCNTPLHEEHMVCKACHGRNLENLRKARESPNAEPHRKEYGKFGNLIFQGADK